MLPLRNMRRFARKAVERPGYAAHVALRRLRADCYYRWSDGKAPLPESVTIFLTRQCNLRCRMCGQWGDKGVAKGASTDELQESLPLPTLEALVRQLAPAGTSFTLFGGEPFLYRDIIPLIDTIRKEGSHCLAITNGSLVSAHAREIVDAGLEELNLSLDGLGPRHDAIRGIDGLFARITSGVSEINRYKALRHSRTPLINLQCTINKNNYLHLEELLQAAERFNANSVTYHHLIFLSDELYRRQEELVGRVFPGTRSDGWRGFIFEPGIEAKALAEKLRKLRRSGGGGSFVNIYPNFTDDELFRYYCSRDYAPHGYRPRCLSPWVAGYVFPDGEVRPCLNLSYRFGNIREKPFAEIWNGPEATAFRKALKGHALFPACVRCTELFRY